MAPAKQSSRRPTATKAKQPRPRAARPGKDKEPPAVPSDLAPDVEAPVDSEHEPLFIDPVFGTPLGIYVEKDVEGREGIHDLISVSVALIVAVVLRAC